MFFLGLLELAHLHTERFAQRLLRNREDFVELSRLRTQYYQRPGEIKRVRQEERDKKRTFL